MMDLVAHAKSVPLGATIGVLILGPMAAAVLAGLLFNDRAWRRGVVIVAAWVLTIAALLLFARGVAEREVLFFGPGAVGGVSWDTVLLWTDLLLLAAFVWIGVARRRPLIVGLGLLQLLPVAYLELDLHAGAQPEPPFYIDWLSVGMALVVSVIGSIVTVYALPYMKEHERHLGLERSRRPRFFLVMFVFLGAMNGLVLANNLLWLAFFWEVTTLCSFLLIGHDGTDEARASADRALWMNLLGGTALVAAILLLHLQGASLSLSRLLQAAASPTARADLQLPMALLCLAAFTKAAQMPFQSWLLGAMVAPTPVSALLHSSTMVKAGVYLVVRLAPVFHGTHLSDAVALVGGFSFLTGAMLAVSQTNIKRILAYSTISNLGLIVACAGLNSPLALAAGLMLIVFHAISKGLLFMAAGVMEHAIHSREVEEMEGLASRMPLTTFLSIVGIISMLLPPFGVLIAKLAAIEASVHQPIALVLFVFGSTFTVIFWTKLMGRLVTTDPHLEHPRIEHLHSMYFGPLILLASGAVVFSLFVVVLLTQLIDPAVRLYYSQVAGGANVTSLGDNVLGFPWVPVFGSLAVAILLPLLLYHLRARDVRSAYLCGEQVEEETSTTFRSFGEEKTPLTVSGFYFERLLGEQVHTRWVTSVSALMLAVMIGVAALWK